jgi:hypothetical protein
MLPLVVETGTKHTAVTALGGILTPEEIKPGGGPGINQRRLRALPAAGHEGPNKNSAGPPSDPRCTTAAQPKSARANP